MSNLTLRTPLNVNQIEFRIQSINRGGYATILAYKDARADMERLDAVYGAEGWQRKHEFKDGRLYCSVGIYSVEHGQWVWKEDVGTESNAEKEKGQASDSFKRACFNLGIGRELYDYPVIKIKLNGSGQDRSEEWFLNELKKDRYGKPTPSQGFALKLKEWSWYSEFNNDGKISFLAAQDNNRKLRFKFGEMKKKENKND